MTDIADRKRRAGQRVLALCLSAVLLVCGWGGNDRVFNRVFAASADPALRYTISTEDAAEQLETGDSVTVTVDISREDGSADPYAIYGIQIDLSYDEELFEVSNVEGPGEVKPDGTAWKGSWSCRAIGTAGRKKIRVLYTNLSLAGGMQNTEEVSGAMEAGRFTLTVKEGAPKGGSSEIGFLYAERVDSELKKGDCITSSPLKLSFAGTAPDAGDGSGGNGSGDSGSGGSGSGGSDSGGGSSDSGGSSGSGSNSGGSGSGSGSSSGSGSNSSSGSAGSGSQNPATGGSGSENSETNKGNNGSTKVAFSDLTDVDETHWAAKAIRDLMEKGVMSGDSDRGFHPEKNVTRAEFASIVARAFRYEYTGAAGSSGSGVGSNAVGAGAENGNGTKNPVTETFKDVTYGDWYFEPVMALYKEGIISGTGTGVFGAGQPLSRQDMTVILHNILQAQNRSLGQKKVYREFQDEHQIADYARQAVQEFYCAGVISGIGGGALAPEQASTRAQAASVVYQILQELEEGR